MSFPVHIRYLGRTAYEPVFRDMQTFTAERTPDTVDEIWFTEHDPVFTQGQAGKPEHVLAPGDIPIVKTDRGGQVTYHGPGQIVGYLMLDLRRLGIGVRALVTGIEQSIVRVLRDLAIEAAPRADAPGVYVSAAKLSGESLSGAKIAALGLRVRRGCSYHGLAFNIDMDMEPFARINPCGLLGIQVTQLKDLVHGVDLAEAQRRLQKELLGEFNLQPA